jgi:thioester reductase-like protein
VRQLIVQLTGTTGSLASEILVKLLQDKGVAQVYTYNRPCKDTDLVTRHRNRFLEKEFDLKLLQDSRVIYLEADTHSDKLGLDDTLYHIVSNIYFICFADATR